MYSTCVYANLLNGPTIYRKLRNANIARTDKSWYEDLLDDGLKSTLTVCPSVLSNFKYWDTRPYDSTNQSAVSSFDLNYFNSLDLRILGNIPGAYVTSHFHKLYKVSPFALKLNF
jgi:hypothetical protein